MTCKQKRRFNTLNEVKLICKFKSAERNKQMYYYKCHCGFYHLTSKSRKEYLKNKNLALSGLYRIFTAKDWDEIDKIFKNYAHGK